MISILFNLQFMIVQKKKVDQSVMSTQTISNLYHYIIVLYDAVKIESSHNQKLLSFEIFFNN